MFHRRQRIKLTGGTFLWVLVAILGIITFLAMEHPIALWCVFVPLAVIFVLAIVRLINGRKGYISNLLTMMFSLFAMIIGLAIIATPAFDKCEHENVDEYFSFQFQNSTASSDLKWICADCYKEMNRARFRGTPTDTSYLEAIAEHSNESDIVGGEYYTITATVTLADYDHTKTRITCSVRNEDTVVGFSVEFKEEFEEIVSSIQEGDEVTFRGRFYDVGCGFTDAELITE